MYSYRDDRTEREKQLEWELERARDDERRRQEREEQAREERRREQKERWEYEDRQADSWTEAFQKQARLCWREHNNFSDIPDIDDYFKQVAEANEKALEIWKEVSSRRQSELDEIQKQIESYWESVRHEVAEQVEKSGEHYSYKNLAESVRDDALGGYLDW